MATLQDLQDFLSTPMAQTGMGMLGSTQTPGPAYQAAAQGAQQQQAVQQQLAAQRFALQQAQARANFNPQQYLLSQQAQQPQQAAGAATQAALANVPGGAQIAASTQTPYQPPAGAIGNVDFQGMLGAGLKAGMTPEEVQQMMMTMDPMTAIMMKNLGLPPVVVPPGGQLVAPGMAQIGQMSGQPPASGATPGTLATNTNPPPDSMLGQLTMLNNAKARLPANSPMQDQLDAAIAKTTGSWEQGNQQDVDATATAIAHGKMAPLTGNAMRSAISQRVMARVTQINPDYDGHNWAMNDEAYKAFATGPQGNQVRSLNVAVNHLGTLGQLADALQNGNTQAVNKIANEYKTQTGTPAPTNFDAAKQIVGDEVVKAVVGSGGAQSDRENAQKVIDAANSPAQLRGVINTYQALLGGQLNGLAKQYTASTGRNDFAARFINQNTQQATGQNAGTTGGGYRLDDIDAVLKARGAIK
jgi:hypothetical protein